MRAGYAEDCKLLVAIFPASALVVDVKGMVGVNSVVDFNGIVGVNDVVGFHGKVGVNGLVGFNGIVGVNGVVGFKTFKIVLRG